MAEQMMQGNASEIAAKQTIPTGYKLTEVGVIPEDWEVQPLSKLSARITDGEHLTPERTDFGYYLLSARNIHNGYLNLSDVDYVGESEYLRIRKRCNPDEGDVLISCSGTIGRVCVLPKGIECVMVRSAALIKAGDNKINGHYVQYFLQSSAGQKQIFSSLNQGAQANLFLNHIQDLRLAYPRIFAEQITIANALADTDALIAGLEQLIAKKQAIKTATMQQLLTGRTRLPQFALRPDGTPKGYKSSELGQIPEDWTIETLGGVTEIVRNGSNYSSVAKDGVAVTRIETIATGYVDVGRTGVAVRESIHELYRVLRGDILYSHINSIDHIGKVARFDDDIELFHGINLILIRTSAVNSLWLFKLLSGEEARKWARQVAKQAVSQASINTKELKGLLLAVPSTQEQTTIATILSDMDSELTALEQKLAKARSLKQGMMQQLLTGRIRLPVEQVE